MASREFCFQFAYQLYREGEDGGEAVGNIWRVGQALKLDANTSQQIADQLKREGLMEYISFEGDASLTSFGTAAIMQALSDTNQATVYFPPIANLLPDGDKNAAIITSASVNAFIDDLTEQAELMLLNENEKIDLEQGISLLEEYIASGACDASSLRAGLEKVNQLLAAEHPLE
ncbi:MAG: hypothetical protein AAF434_04400 [Pseudomonadota bacterium]